MYTHVKSYDNVTAARFIESGQIRTAVPYMENMCALNTRKEENEVVADEAGSVLAAGTVESASTRRTPRWRPPVFSIHARHSKAIPTALPVSCGLECCRICWARGSSVRRGQTHPTTLGPRCCHWRHGKLRTGSSWQVHCRRRAVFRSAHLAWISKGSLCRRRASLRRLVEALLLLGGPRLSDTFRPLLRLVLPVPVFNFYERCAELPRHTASDTNR